MCDLHSSVLNIVQDLQDASQNHLAAPRKPLCVAGGLKDNPRLAPRFLPLLAQTTPQKPAATVRKKLWELDHFYHCSVIGTCLTLAELRQIQRRLGGLVQGADSDYDLHRAFVSAAREATPASRLIHKHLERKYKPAIQQLGKAQSTEEFAAFWDAALATGEVAGAYWALITQPGAPMSLLDRIYGEIHMLSHLSGASIRVDMQELNRLKRRCPELERQLAEAQIIMRRRLAEQQESIGALNARLAQTVETERKLQAAEARLTMLEEQTQATQLSAEVESLTSQLTAERDRADRANAAAAAAQQQATRTVAHNQWLAQQMNESQQERDLLEATLARLLHLPCADLELEIADNASADGDASLDLVGRCVLYVGGRPNQCAHFRTLVERCNGRFIHHDGGREDARSQLWDVMQQADAVLCPLDCVSHDAMQRVKRFCERNTKPLVWLPRASLAAFNRGLNRVAFGASPS